VTTTVEVRAGRRYRVRVRPLVKRETPVPVKGFPEARTASNAPEIWPPPIVTLRDGGAAITETAGPSGLINQLTAIRFESSPVPTIEDAINQNQTMLANVSTDGGGEYLWSGRRYRTRAVPFAHSSEVGGYNTVLYLDRRERDDPEALDIRRTYAVAPNLAHVSRMRTIEEQLEDWEALRGAFATNTAEWERGRAQIKRLYREQFDAISTARNRAQNDLYLRAIGTSPGLWAPSFIGGLVYYNWDPLDTTNYRTVLATSPDADGKVPWMPVGEDQQTRLECFLAPRRFEIRIAWVSLFYIIVFFAPPILVAEANFTSYSDRLPLTFSWAGEGDSLVNDRAMSDWIAGSRAYATGLNEDVGSQVITPFYVKILAGRVDGIWTIHSANQREGDLAAVLDCTRGSRTDRYLVTRRTTIQGGDVINWGALGTQEVIPHTRGTSQFALQYEYGPL
jgi:hypothetical protein